MDHFPARYVIHYQRLFSRGVGQAPPPTIEAFFGCTAAECVGSSCSHIVSGRGFDSSAAAAALNKVPGPFKKWTRLDGFCGGSKLSLEQKNIGSDFWYLWYVK